MTSANIESVITETLSAADADEISGDRGIQHSDFLFIRPSLMHVDF